MPDSYYRKYAKELHERINGIYKSLLAEAQQKRAENRAILREEHLQRLRVYEEIERRTRMEQEIINREERRRIEEEQHREAQRIFDELLQEKQRAERACERLLEEQERLACLIREQEKSSCSVM